MTRSAWAADGRTNPETGHRRRWVPVGLPLPAHVWRRRHRWVVRLLAVQVVLVWVFALEMGYDSFHATLHVAAPAAMALGATWKRLGRPTRSVLAATGLMVLSGALVHSAGGAIEAHFHFFAMVPLVAVYQSWWAFGAATSYVLLQHGIVGTLTEGVVYNHPAAQENPWQWAGIHAALFAVACAGSILNWKLHEDSLVAEAHMRYAANHDAMTGLPNRLHVFARLEAALLESRSETYRLRPTVLLVDLDGFKPVNDRFGHHHGDAVLVEVASRLRCVVPAADVVARLGGDEFVILTTGSRDAAEGLASQIAAALAVPIPVAGQQIRLGASIGIATADASSDSDSLMQEADRAMYEVKRDRRTGRQARDSAVRLRVIPSRSSAFVS